MTRIVEAAKNRKPPSSLARYKNAGLDLLASVCAEFQVCVGDRPFHLSARVAGGLLGVDAMTGWRYLRRVQEHRLLLCAEKGQPGQNGKATRWRYVGNGDATECAI